MSHINVLVLSVFCTVCQPDDREHIGRAFCKMGVAIHYFLVYWFPLYSQWIFGLLTVIGQHAILQVALLQIGDVDKGHATHVETKHKDVACKGENMSFGEL